MRPVALLYTLLALTVALLACLLALALRAPRDVAFVLALLAFCGSLLALSAAWLAGHSGGEK